MTENSCSTKDRIKEEGKLIATGVSSINKQSHKERKKYNIKNKGKHCLKYCFYSSDLYVTVCY